MDKNAKTIIIYYSAQGHTKDIATKIANHLGADTFEIEPVQPYTEDDLSWFNSDSRVFREHNEKSLQNVELKNVSVPNWDAYDRIIIGYPIWWGVSAWPVDSFVKKTNFNGKTVIPFCTSHSSELGSSDEYLKNKAPSGDWQPGFRFFQDATDADIENWIKSL